MPTHGRTSPMTEAEVKAIRTQLGLSARELAWLLDCQEQTIRNLESTGQHRRHPSRQMALLLHLLRYPDVRERLETLARQRQE
jgi:DNA-binding transcriptional regulator YiaG